MSLSIRETPGGQRTSTKNADLTSTYQVSYMVDSTIQVGPKTVREFVLTSVGQIGSTYSYGLESDTASFLQTIEVESAVEDGYTWKALLTYGPNDNSYIDNPFAKPVEVSVDWVARTRFTNTDRFGNPIVNSAGDLFPEPIEVEEYLPIISISRNEPDYPLGEVFQYANAVNSSATTNFAAGTLKAIPPRATLQHSPNSGVYWNINYKFQINPSGYDISLYDRGLRELKDDKLRDIIVDGQPVNQPAFLDGSGLKLAEDGDPVSMSWSVYPTKDYSFFNLTL